MKKIYGYHTFGAFTGLRLRVKLDIAEREQMQEAYYGQLIVHYLPTGYTLIEGMLHNRDISLFKSNLKRAILMSRITFLNDEIAEHDGLIAYEAEMREMEEFFIPATLDDDIELPF